MYYISSHFTIKKLSRFLSIHAYESKKLIGHINDYFDITPNTTGMFLGNISVQAAEFNIYV